MEIVDLQSCIKHITSQRVRPASISLPAAVLDRIRDDLQDLTLVKDAPRPTYGAPYGDIDRLLWDELQALRKITKIRVLGVDLLPSDIQQTTREA